MSVRVPIKPNVLEWAIRKTGAPVEELAQSSDFKNIIEWLTEDKAPTVRQAEKLAAKAGIPYPFLLLNEPVQDEILLPDFRTRGNISITNPSPELEQVINDCTARLDWYVEFARDEDLLPVALIESAHISQSPEQTAIEVRDALGWVPGRYSLGETAVSKLSAAIENTGILVMRSAMVKNNTKRPLDQGEFSGFTLINNGFALIFVNAKDTKSAQLFSLAHELGHVVTGQPGISAEHSPKSELEVERWCNKFAAEFLIPATYFGEIWSEEHSPTDAVSRIAQRVGASPEAVVWRGVELGFIPSGNAQSLIKECSYDGPRKTPDGGNGLNNIRPRIGQRFLAAVSSVIGTDLLSITDAMYYLGTKNRETVRDLMSPREKSA
ncbi:hypothetical protein N24_2952 [Corynebacterium suranareeae]|uniref:IrrE N-terminal-like domain-containing protein n=1 Tax=Corynebacterium suranareeae TaxID=2506452 RepID=A0A169S6M2_9CORY|nr:ImmA/IrrE family metallo-endopeptidase [Corynebacterium suranareeae]BAU97214.1 hypothetical protein N24_2952 [Corynebacterium suranareeae]